MSMLYLFFFISCTMLVSNTNDQSMDCSKFRNGVFYIPATDKLTECRIDRKDKIQKESSADMSSTAIFKVKWLDDCTYTLTPTKKTLKNLYPDQPKSAQLTVTITEVRENSYI